MTPLEDLLAIAARVLAEAAATFALIGGCARNAYAPPRATQDVDVAVAVDAAGFQRIVAAFTRAGFSQANAVHADATDAVPDLVIFCDASGRRIDLLFAKTPFEIAAVDRRIEMAFDIPERLPIVTVEDFLIYKLIAGRPHDLLDAVDVVRTQLLAGYAFDWPLVERWCAEWEITPRLETLRHACSPPG